MIALKFHGSACPNIQNEDPMTTTHWTLKNGFRGSRQKDKGNAHPITVVAGWPIVRQARVIEGLPGQ